MTVRATTPNGVNSSIPGSRRNETLSAVGFQKNARVNFAFDPTTIENFEAAAAKYVQWRPETRKPHHFNRNNRGSEECSRCGCDHALP